MLIVPAHQFVSLLMHPTIAVINLWKCSAPGIPLSLSLSHSLSVPLSPPQSLKFIPRITVHHHNSTSSLPLHILRLFKQFLYSMWFIYSCVLHCCYFPKQKFILISSILSSSFIYLFIFWAWQFPCVGMETNKQLHVLTSKKQKKNKQFI